MNVGGARILVIGGVRRLGGTVARDLADLGAAVCVTTRTPDAEADAQVEALRAAGAAAAAVVFGDASSAPGASRLVHDGSGALGGLDALVFAASGPFAPAAPHTVSETTWDASFDTVAKGFFFAAAAARGHLLAVRSPGERPGGVIVAVTDLLGLRPWPAFAAHSAAKAAQINLVGGLAGAWADDGIRVCGVAPGPVDLEDDEHRDATLRAARGEVGRLVQPQDVAAAVRFCLEDEGVTGVNIPVDNGSLLGR